MSASRTSPEQHAADGTQQAWPPTVKDEVGRVLHPAVYGGLVEPFGPEVSRLDGEELDNQIREETWPERRAELSRRRALLKAREEPFGRAWRYDIGWWALNSAIARLDPDNPSARPNPSEAVQFCGAACRLFRSGIGPWMLAVGTYVCAASQLLAVNVADPEDVGDFVEGDRLLATQGLAGAEDLHRITRAWWGIHRLLLLAARGTSAKVPPGVIACLDHADDQQLCDDWSPPLGPMATQVRRQLGSSGQQQLAALATACLGDPEQLRRRDVLDALAVLAGPHPEPVQRDGAVRSAQTTADHRPEIPDLSEAPELPVPDEVKAAALPTLPREIRGTTPDVETLRNRGEWSRLAQRLDDSSASAWVVAACWIWAHKPRRAVDYVEDDFTLAATWVLACALVHLDRPKAALGCVEWIGRRVKLWEQQAELADALRGLLTPAGTPERRQPGRPTEESESTPAAQAGNGPPGHLVGWFQPPGHLSVRAELRGRVARGRYREVAEALEDERRTTEAAMCWLLADAPGQALRVLEETGVIGRGARWARLCALVRLNRLEKAARFACDDGTDEFQPDQLDAVAALLVHVDTPPSARPDAVRGHRFFEEPEAGRRLGWRRLEDSVRAEVFRARDSDAVADVLARTRRLVHGADSDLGRRVLVRIAVDAVRETADPELARSAVDDLADYCADVATTGRIDLDLVVAGLLPAVIAGDSVRYRQLLDELGDEVPAAWRSLSLARLCFAADNDPDEARRLAQDAIDESAARWLVTALHGLAGPSDEHLDDEQYKLLTHSLPEEVIHWFEAAVRPGSGVAASKAVELAATWRSRAIEQKLSATGRPRGLRQCMAHWAYYRAIIELSDPDPWPGRALILATCGARLLDGHKDDESVRAEVLAVGARALAMLAATVDTAHGSDGIANWVERSALYQEAPRHHRDRLRGLAMEWWRLYRRLAGWPPGPTGGSGETARTLIDWRLLRDDSSRFDRDHLETFAELLEQAGRTGSTILEQTLPEGLKEAGDRAIEERSASDLLAAAPERPHPEELNKVVTELHDKWRGKDVELSAIRKTLADEGFRDLFMKACRVEARQLRPRLLRWPIMERFASQFAYEAYRAGFDAFEKGDLAAARDSFEEAWLDQPRSRDATAGLCLALRDLAAGDGSDAAEARHLLGHLADTLGTWDGQEMEAALAAVALADAVEEDNPAEARRRLQAGAQLLGRHARDTRWLGAHRAQVALYHQLDDRDAVVDVCWEAARERLPGGDESFTLATLALADEDDVRLEQARTRLRTAFKSLGQLEGEAKDEAVRIALERRQPELLWPVPLKEEDLSVLWQESRGDEDQLLEFLTHRATNGRRTRPEWLEFTADVLADTGRPDRAARAAYRLAALDPKKGHRVLTRLGVPAIDAERGPAARRLRLATTALLTLDPLEELAAARDDPRSGAVREFNIALRDSARRGYESGIAARYRDTLDDLLAELQALSRGDPQSRDRLQARAIQAQQNLHRVTTQFVQPDTTTCARLLGEHLRRGLDATIARAYTYERDFRVVPTDLARRLQVWLEDVRKPTSLDLSHLAKNVWQEPDKNDNLEKCRTMLKRLRTKLEERATQLEGFDEEDFGLSKPLGELLDALPGSPNELDAGCAESIAGKMQELEEALKGCDLSRHNLDWPTIGRPAGPFVPPITQLVGVFEHNADEKATHGEDHLVVVIGMTDRTGRDVTVVACIDAGPKTKHGPEAVPWNPKTQGVVALVERFGGTVHLWSAWGNTRGCRIEDHSPCRFDRYIRPIQASLADEATTLDRLATGSLGSESDVDKAVLFRRWADRLDDALAGRDKATLAFTVLPTVDKPTRHPSVPRAER